MSVGVLHAAVMGCSMHKMLKAGMAVGVVYTIAVNVVPDGYDAVDVIAVAMLVNARSVVDWDSIAVMRPALELAVGRVDRSPVVDEQVVDEGGEVVVEPVASEVVGASVEEVKQGSGFAAVDEEEMNVLVLGSAPSSVAGSDSGGDDCGVKMPASGFVTAGVKIVSGKGGFSFFRPDDGANRVVEAPSLRVFATSPRVRTLRQILRKHGVMVPKSALVDLALASCAAACVPSEYERGRDALRVLEYVGDRALTLVDAKRCYAEGIAVSSAQERSSSKFSNAAMSRAFAKSSLVKCCLYPGGVDVSVGRVGASFVEAIAGVVELHVASSASMYAFMAMLKL